MTLEQLRIFVEVAARQHITQAAAHLNMTQSAVSAAITALESRHHVALFDRVGRSIVLNQTGRVFLKEAQAVLSSARAAEAALMDLSGLMHGELSIMASQTVAGYWLAPRLADYRNLYPGIALKRSHRQYGGSHRRRSAGKGRDRPHRMAAGTPEPVGQKDCH